MNINDGQQQEFIGNCTVLYCRSKCTASLMIHIRFLSQLFTFISDILRIFRIFAKTGILTYFCVIVSVLINQFWNVLQVLC